MMRMIVDGLLSGSTSMGSPGMDEVRWLKPLRPGAQVRVRVVVLETRASKGRPEMGLVRFMFELIDDSHAVLTTMTATLMMGRRQAGAAA